MAPQKEMAIGEISSLLLELPNTVRMEQLENSTSESSIHMGNLEGCYSQLYQKLPRYLIGPREID